MSRLFRLGLVFMLTLGMLLPAASNSVAAQPSAPTGGPATDLFFSEYIESLGGSNKALEIYNGTGSSVNLSTYTVELYSNGSSSAGSVQTLSGTLLQGDVFVIRNSGANDQKIIDEADLISSVTNFNGDDAVVLKRNGTIIDSIGQVGVDPGTQWAANGVSTLDQTLVRKDTITTGDPIANNAFDPSVEWDSYGANDFTHIGFHTLAGAPAPIITSCPTTIDAYENIATSREITAMDSDSAAISASLVVTPTSGITLTNMMTSTGAYTADLEIDGSLAIGTYTATINFTNEDNETASCDITINVLSLDSVPTIGEIQGIVSDTANGQTHASPFNNQTVTVRGVVYEEVLIPASLYGIFIQNTAATNDGNPDSSDGIFVFLGSSESVNGINPQVGDEILIRARVQERFNLTQLTSVEEINILDSGLDIEAQVPAFDATPPANWADAMRYWERREGMRGRVLANSQVEGGLDVFGLDAELWSSPPNSFSSECNSPYAERIYRDAHPCDNDPALFDDGNGFRVLMGSYGVKYTTGISTTLLPPGKTFDIITNSPAGGVYYSFSKYMIQVTEQPVLQPTLDPANNNPPTTADRSVEFSTAIFNVENLYDFRDDPFDGCDFTGNAGCPGVTPPFDYVPASNQEYRNHIDGLANQIVTDLHLPAVIMIQEAEDQDICRFEEFFIPRNPNGGGFQIFQCGTTDNADGQPDSVQDLASTVQNLSGIEYVAAYDRDGADDRGIVTAFMFRTDMVTLTGDLDIDPTMFYTMTTGYTDVTSLPMNNDMSNPQAFNATLSSQVNTSTGKDGNNIFTRAPEVAQFVITSTNNITTEYYFINNHFSSGPDRRVGQRAEQANYVAAIVAAIEAQNPAAQIIVGGDFNVFPRPDDPFAPGDSAFPSDQLAGLYDQGLMNLWDVVADQAPENAYSYHFQGQAQTLDQIFVNDNSFNALGEIRYAHINSDWAPGTIISESKPVAAPDGIIPVPLTFYRGTSDHDPAVAQFFFEPSEVTGSKVADATMYTSGDTITYTLTISNSGGVSTTFNLTDTLDPNLTLLSTNLQSSNPQDLSASGVISAGTVLTYTIVAEISQSFTGTLTNTAYLSTMTMSDTLTSVVTVGPPPMPIITGSKTVNSTMVESGDVFTYTITLTNSGTLTGTGTLEDIVDSNLTVITTTLPLISGNTYSESVELAPGEVISFTITVSTTDSFTGTIDNTATFDDGNQTMSFDAPPVTVGPMGMTMITGSKMVNKTTVNAGEVFTYTLTVTNSGNLTSTGTLVDGIDPSLTVVSTTLPIQQGEFYSADVELGPGDVVTYTIAVSTTSMFSGTINNSATYIEDGSSNETTFSAPAVNVVYTPMAMIDAEKLVSTNTVTAGQLLTYTIRIYNTGSVTGSYRFTDTLDAAFTIVDAGDAAVENDDTLIGSGELGPNSFIDYVFVVRVDRNASGDITNSAEISGDGITEPFFASVTVTVSPLYTLYLPIVRKPNVTP